MCAQSQLSKVDAAPLIATTADQRVRSADAAASLKSGHLFNSVRPETASPRLNRRGLIGTPLAHMCSTTISWLRSVIAAVLKQNATRYQARRARCPWRYRCDLIEVGVCRSSRGSLTLVAPLDRDDLKFVEEHVANLSTDEITAAEAPRPRFKTERASWPTTKPEIETVYV